MRVTLIRHGKTAGNLGLKYIGRTDEELATEGIAQLEAMCKDESVETVFVSPLKRTRQTAALLFPKARQIVSDDLREMDFGDFEGLSFAELSDNADYKAWVDSGCLISCPNGESRAVFSNRVCAAFADIVSNAEKQGEKDLVFVVHGGTIMAVMDRFAIPRKGYFEHSVKNCRGYVCDVMWSGDGSFTLENYTSWIQEL